MHLFFQGGYAHVNEQKELNPGLIHHHQQQEQQQRINETTTHVAGSVDGVDEDAKHQQAIVAATAYAAAAAAVLEPMASQMRAYCDQWASSFLDNLQQHSSSAGVNSSAEEAQRMAYSQWKLHQQQVAAAQFGQQQLQPQPTFPPAAYGQHQSSIYEQQTPQQVRSNKAHQQNVHTHQLVSMFSG